MDLDEMKTLAKSLGNLVGQTVLADKMLKSVKTSPLSFCEDLVDATSAAYGLNSEEELRLIQLIEKESVDYVDRVKTSMNKHILQGDI